MPQSLPGSTPVRHQGITHTLLGPITIIIRIMIEEHFYWGVAVHRWAHDGGQYLENFKSLFGSIPAFIERKIKKQVGYKIEEQARSAGIGRHSRLDLEKMCCR